MAVNFFYIKMKWWYNILLKPILYICFDSYTVTWESSVCADITPIFESRRCKTYSILNLFDFLHASSSLSSSPHCRPNTSTGMAYSVMVENHEHTDSNLYSHTYTQSTIVMDGYVEDSCLIKTLFLQFWPQKKKNFYFHQGFNSWLNKLSRGPITALSIMPL